jgi:hypothetical protein
LGSGHRCHSSFIHNGYHQERDELLQGTGKQDQEGHDEEDLEHRNLHKVEMVSDGPAQAFDIISALVIDLKLRLT